MSQPASKKPHEDRLVKNYAAFRIETNPTKRERLNTLMYNDVKALSFTLIVKKYGYSDRIDIDSIAHDVASSALMTIIRREKEVFSWVQLVKKMSYDWVNKWMKANLYSRESQHVQLDDTAENEDGDERAIEIPCYDLGSDVVKFFFSHLEERAEAVLKLLAPLQGPKGKVIARLAVQKALYETDGLLHLLPPYQQARVNFYAHKVRETLLPVVSASHFEKAFL